MVSELLYCVFVMPRCSCKPSIFAFPMLVRSRNAARYNNDSHGMSRRSNFHSSRRSWSPRRGYLICVLLQQALGSEEFMKRLTMRAFSAGSSPSSGSSMVTFVATGFSTGLSTGFSRSDPADIVGLGWCGRTIERGRGAMDGPRERQQWRWWC